MKKFRMAVGTVAFAAMLLTGPGVAHGAAPSDLPYCMEITHPTITGADLSAEGATWRWSGGSPAPNGYVYFMNRFVNGTWVPASGWGEMGGATSYFAPWVVNGEKATAMTLSVALKCYSAGVPIKNYQVNYADYERQAAATAAAEQAAANAAAQAAAQQLLAQQQAAAPKKKRVECVNRKTKEIKTFARWKCPTGWKRY